MRMGNRRRCAKSDAKKKKSEALDFSHFPRMQVAPVTFIDRGRKMKVYPESNRVSGSWAADPLDRFFRSSKVLYLDPFQLRGVVRARSLPESEWACLDIKWMHKSFFPPLGTCFFCTRERESSTSGFSGQQYQKDFAGSISISGGWFPLLSFFSAYNRNVETLLCRG